MAAAAPHSEGFDPDSCTVGSLTPSVLRRREARLMRSSDSPLLAPLAESPQNRRRLKRAEVRQ